MLNVLIPMAGPSDAFEADGYGYPKPLIEVAGRTMIERVLDGPLALPDAGNFVFVVRDEDCMRHHLDGVLRLLVPGASIVRLRRPTQGALCSALMAVDHLSLDDPLLILNSDQTLDIDWPATLDRFAAMQADAGVLTFQSLHPRWSYVRLENGVVVQASEKRPISRHAIAGFYFFARARDFIEAARQAIRDQDDVDGQYYLSASINQVILGGGCVLAHEVERHCYHSFYSPQFVRQFERLHAGADVGAVPESAPDATHEY